jgi:hypothetical protein
VAVAAVAVESRLNQLSTGVGQRIDSAFLSLRDPEMRSRLAQAKFASGMAVKGTPVVMPSFFLSCSELAHFCLRVSVVPVSQCPVLW